jgi:hypothetical protein
MTRLAFLGLYAVPALNWLTTESVLAAWQPSPGTWLLLASANGLCVMGLFLGYLTLAWRHPGVPAADAGPAGGLPSWEVTPTGERAQ